RHPYATTFPYTTLFRSKGRAHGNTGLLHRYFFQYSQQRLVGLWRQPVDRVKIVPQLIGVQRNRLRRRVKVGGESVQRQRHPLARSEEHTSELQSPDHLG